MCVHVRACMCVWEREREREMRRGKDSYADRLSVCIDNSVTMSYTPFWQAAVHTHTQRHTNTKSTELKNKPYIGSRTFKANGVKVTQSWRGGYWVFYWRAVGEKAESRLTIIHSEHARLLKNSTGVSGKNGWWLRCVNNNASISQKNELLTCSCFLRKNFSLSDLRLRWPDKK